MCWIGTGAANDALLGSVAGHLAKVFGVPVRRLHEDGRPDDAWDPRRRQHASGRILRWILDRHGDGPEKILAVTDADLFIPVLTFVYGEAQLGGRAAVVSTCRLGGSAAWPAPRARFEERLRKECTHELGHTFGLIHCHAPGCVMGRSPGVRDVDSKSGSLCLDCRDVFRDRRRAKE